MTRGLDNLSDDEQSKHVVDELLDEVDAKMPMRKGWKDLDSAHRPSVVSRERERVINIMTLKEGPKPNKFRDSSLLTLNRNQGFFAGDQEDLRGRQDIQIEE